MLSVLLADAYQEQLPGLDDIRPVWIEARRLLFPPPPEVE